MADLFEGVNAAAVMKHIKEHAVGNGNARALDPELDLPVRDRVLALQRLQLDEFERRIGLAKTRAAQMNYERANLQQADGTPWPEVDWSDFLDVLGKDMQGAIGSILKTQGLTDKRDKAQGDLKLGLFEAMTNAGLAPKIISGGRVSPLPLNAGDVTDDSLSGDVTDD